MVLKHLVSRKTPVSGTKGTTASGSPIVVDLARRKSAHVLEVTGTPVHYWEYSAVGGGGSSAPHPIQTLVMVHGFRGDHHGLERVVELLPDYRIIMADLPGFGASPAFATSTVVSSAVASVLTSGVPSGRPSGRVSPDAKHDIAGYGAFLAAFLDGLQLGPDTVLLGHSFGSIVVSHFVAAHPDRVRLLILINPIAAPALEGRKGVMTKLAVFYYWASAKLPAPLGNALLRSKLIVHVMSVTMAKTRDKDLLAFIHDQHHSYFSGFANRDMLLESFQASVSGTVREVASSLTLPTLLIAGTEDEIATLPNQHKLMELLPDAELVVIDKVGHLIHYETPEPAAAAISSFMEGHPAA